MAKGDVTLSRRDHRALLSHLEMIEKRHTKRLDPQTGQVIEPAFPHDDESHEDEVRDCPQCDVLDAVKELRRLLLPVEEVVDPTRREETITAEEAQRREDEINGRVKA